MEWVHGTWLDLYAAEFLIRYIPLGIAALVASVAIWRYLPRRWRRTTYPPLDSYETAMLAGGMPRVCQAAVSMLHGRHLIAFNSGEMRLVQDATESAAEHPVEEDVLSAAFIGAKARELPGVLRRRADELRLSLVSKGYWLNDVEAFLLRAAATLPMLAWLVLGALKTYVGAQRERDVGLLAVLLVLGTLALIGLLNRPIRSEGGWSHLATQKKRFRETNSDMEAITGTSAGLMAVALLGLPGGDETDTYFSGGGGGDGTFLGGGGGCSGCSGCGGCGGCGG